MTPAWYLVFILVFIWSGLHPKDFFTWLLEVAPAVIAFVLLLATRHRFRFTPLCYGLILLHSVILMIGGHYTYAEVPLFDWLRDTLGLARNNYDKLGHFTQGFVPALVSREILIRNRVVNGRIWTNFVVVAICLAISALYELIEWGVAVASGGSADAFLGLQGDVWDTQSDMAWALTGAVGALLLLARVHDRQLDKTAAVSGGRSPAG